MGRDKWDRIAVVNSLNMNYKGLKALKEKLGGKEQDVYLDIPSNKASGSLSNTDLS